MTPHSCACVQSGAAAVLASYSPFRMFAAADEEKQPPVAAPSDLADKVAAAAEPAAVLEDDVRRRVQMTKAFTALRADITSEKSPQKVAPAKKASKWKAAPAKKVPVQRKGKAIAKVKAEPMRRSSRSSGYKKGQFSEATLTKLAWSGQGSRTSPIIC
jgi:hypothetical protein